MHPVIALGLAVAVTAGLLLEVDLPSGGRVPVGHAFVLALVYALEPSALVPVLGLGLALWLPILARREGPSAAVRRAVSVGLAATAAGLVTAALRAAGGAGAAESAIAKVGSLLAASIAYLAVDLAGTFLRKGSRSRHDLVRVQVPLYVTFFCTACLLGLAYGSWMELFAVVPLVVTRFSFQRYSAARSAYDQTVRALGIVPELAGHVTLGHSERTGAYAALLAGRLGVGDAARDRVVIAARLHDIGRIALTDERDHGVPRAPSEVRRAGAAILRQTGFLADVADLVGRVADPSAAPGDERAAAIVRVAAAFDELVGDDPSRVRGALALLASRLRDPGDADVIAALRELHGTDPTIVERAIGAGTSLTRAALAAELAHRVSTRRLRVGGSGDVGGGAPFERGEVDQRG